VVVRVGIVVNEEIVRTIAVLLVIEFEQRKRVGRSGTYTVYRKRRESPKVMWTCLSYGM
jgi:hypothetical protein